MDLEAGQLGHDFVEDGGGHAADAGSLVPAVELGEADGGVEVGHGVEVAEEGVALVAAAAEGGGGEGAAEGAVHFGAFAGEAHGAACEGLVVGDNHAALVGGEGLATEREAADVADGADELAAVFGEVGL